MIKISYVGNTLLLYTLAVSLRVPEILYVLLKEFGLRRETTKAWGPLKMVIQMTSLNEQ